MLFSSLLALTALVASPVFAHFKLTNPPARGSDELTQDQGPCGGYNTPQTSRPDFKKDSKVSIRMADKTAEATVYLGTGGNPTSFPYQIGHQSFTKIGVYDMSVDFSKLPASVKTGSVATVQIILKGDHGTLYQCADVKVVR
ncbi:hypothetical protein BATDEDRAFT_34896 [Batrachochytrium dendrobatidis JAM81]|uniref:Copper acquisition factor BIM1-like domain-containing protein n=2 Tax=Batrachochytrium dendrobatidis TaxID=109871 RepID=F4P0T3_BATDJ|nr:uncharacterized protein BATDEDRAFT_34896 [Batrachochytrium dendrobatidis JAM81]EGF81336.1 hypothetical protein BATDEDRAFT_34896 [Batrachochytrium dendrobatidis JAM81]KAJ8329596.1 hypothetical protein O5D80_002165 [Batrachochytrium dendrobatidis]OAJ38016.1 hypothetical protein BDEG_21985 [Batrachochytrium dendrobatidis JEL423]|eukprot:XP_006678033.1 hypothetical protein BATDEDRAFT_34896 [Batrachochytrium dendrobatidis JAM81]